MAEKRISEEGILAQTEEARIEAAVFDLKQQVLFLETLTKHTREKTQKNELQQEGLTDNVTSIKGNLAIVEKMQDDLDQIQGVAQAS